MTHDHERFLAALRHDPADIAAWQVFADFLEEQGDPTCEFIRLSLELTLGKTPHGSAEASIGRFEALWPKAIQEVRELLASYRSTLPVRFRVIERIWMGETPPQEMFDDERTLATGYLEAGTIQVLMDLGVGKRADGRPEWLRTIICWPRKYENAPAAAGKEPIRLGLGWDGHLEIDADAVLTQRAN
jgi:uncharacterized protein (TIGR02996 family)